MGMIVKMMFYKGTLQVTHSIQHIDHFCRTNENMRETEKEREGEALHCPRIDEAMRRRRS